MKKLLVAFAIAVSLVASIQSWAQTNVSTNAVTSVSSNRVATTGVISQATGDIVGAITTFIATQGSAGVGYAIPLSKSSKNVGDGPEATVQVYLYDVAWVSGGLTNIDSKLGIINATVFGKNRTGNQLGAEISEALNTDGIAAATAKIPVLNVITRAAAKLNIDLTGSISHDTDQMANGVFNYRYLDVGVGCQVIKTF